MDFETEYNKYKNDVYRLAYSYTVNKQDTEDILQKVFIKLYYNLNKFTDSEKIKHWLIIVTINQCKNSLGSYWKRKIIHIKDNDIDNISSTSNYTLIYSYFSKLKKDYRIPLYLNIICGYTSKEIADIMSTTDASIKMRLKRAKEILKLELEENYEK